MPQGTPSQITDRDSRLLRHLTHLSKIIGVKVYGDRYNSLIRLQDVVNLIRHITENYRPLGTDRISLLIWLSGLEKECKLLYTRWEHPASTGYERLLELEVARIAGLPEPERTVVAIDFVERIREAKTLAVAYRKYVRSRTEAEKREYRKGELGRRGKLSGMRWWKQLEKLAMGEYVSPDVHVWPPSESR